MKLLDLAKIQHPKIMAEFNRDPWNYKIFPPMGFDDPAIITIYLYIGKTKATKAYKIEINLFAQGIAEQISIK